MENKNNLNLKENKIDLKKVILMGAVCFAIAMVVFPETTARGSKAALLVWLNAVVPVLLPFFILAEFIKRIGNLQRIRGVAYPAVMALLSGYPMGAKATGDLYAAGRLSKDEARAVLSYSMVTGPAFLMGTVGAFLGEREAALTVAAAHYLGAALCGAVYRQGRKTVCKTTNEREGEEGAERRVSEGFTASIFAAFRSMAVILGYITIFMIGIEILDGIGLIGMFPSPETEALAKGVMEMTIGARQVGLLACAAEVKVGLVAFIVSFGGLSVIGQSAAMTGGGWISPREIFLMKLTHGIFSGILGTILSWIVL